MFGRVSADMQIVPGDCAGARPVRSRALLIMISIRRLLDLNPAGGKDADLADTAARLKSMITEALSSWRPLKRDLGSFDSRNTLRLLLARLEKTNSPDELAAIAADALSAAEEYVRESGECFDEHRAHMQAMISMLKTTIGDLAGQSEASVSRLAGIERQIQRAAAMDDLRPLKASLADCLAAVRDAAAEQKRATQATVERLQEHIRRAPQPPVSALCPPPPFSSHGLAAPDYVAAFKLQHADHIVKRFGESARDHMLSLMAEGLGGLQGGNDRLMRWKGPSFVMFLTSAESLPVIRQRLTLGVAKISQRYVELGGNAALMAVSVDWTVFARAHFPSIDVAFDLVDAFLAGDAKAQSPKPEGPTAGAQAGRVAPLVRKE